MAVMIGLRILSFSFICYLPLISALSKPLGVPISKLPLYKINEPFSCLDGSQASIPWHMVNDDYCDCRDGSDEPGTSACSNGLFYCENKGFQGTYIPSSRVNDHICDCCDGSDEYLSRAKCSNTCWELGKEARARQEEKERVMRDGNKLYQEHVKMASEKIIKHQARVEILKTELEQALKVKEQLQAVKDEAEAKEKEVRTAADEVLAGKKKAWEERQDKRKGLKMFRLMDANHDGRVEISELQSFKQLDIDQNGEVSDAEAREYLNDEDSVDSETFLKSVWPNIRELFKPSEAKKPEDQQEELGSHDADKDEEVEETDDTSSHLKSEEPVEVEGMPPEAEDVEPKPEEFDESAQAVINAAESARQKYNEAASEVKKLEEEKKGIEVNLNRDYGKDSAFFILAESSDCYSMDDREYTYTICPFKEITQRPKQGGMDTNLGRWSRWQEEYSVQLYDNGLACWNGPSRSTKVSVICGVENKLMQVDEPSRCEYTMTFATPAACHEHISEDSQQKHGVHEDL